MKKLLILLIFIALAGAGFYVGSTHSEKLPVVKPVRGPALQAVYASGTVEPSVMIPIAARQGARLISILADEGSKVSKGDVLGQLEDTDLRNALVELQAKADLAAKELVRKNELYKAKATSQQDVDQAQAANDAAQAAVERATAELSYMKLTAPEDGLVIRREGEQGEMIPAGQPVFWMSCCKPLRIASEVDEEDISLVTPGQDVLISADAFPGKIFNGKVVSITPKGDPVARSYRVRIGLEGDTPLLIGMTTETNIVTHKSQNALLIPTTAVAKNKVWVVEGSKLHRVNVETGARTQEAVEITDGLDENATVVMNTSDTFDEGQIVFTKLRDWQTQ